MMVCYCTCLYLGHQTQIVILVCVPVLAVWYPASCCAATAGGSYYALIQSTTASQPGSRVCLGRHKVLTAPAGCKPG